MVGVAQLVELQVVALVAAGSSPVAHPKLKYTEGRRTMDEGQENASLVSANVVSAHPSSLGFFIAPVAQLDRASDFESAGRRFDSCRAHQI